MDFALFIQLFFFFGGPCFLFCGLMMPKYNDDYIMFTIIGAVWTAIAAIVLIYLIYRYFEEKAEAKQKLILEQKTLESQQRELANLVGLEKMYQMDRIRTAKNAECLEILRRNSQKMLKYSIEKESDWATIGGLASGIAGPAAGLAAAVDTMNNNQRIREENEKKRQDQRNLESWIDKAKKADESSPMLAELEEKYTVFYDLSSAQIMEKFLIIKSSYVIDSDTGAITVIVELGKIMDKVRTPGKNIMCFDGSIKAKITDSDGNHSGDAYLVFPQNGFDSVYCTLRGICTTPHPKDYYKIEFEPVKLWELYDNDVLRSIRFWCTDTDTDTLWKRRLENK